MEPPVAGMQGTRRLGHRAVARGLGAAALLLALAAWNQGLPPARPALLVTALLVGAGPARRPEVLSWAIGCALAAATLAIAPPEPSLLARLAGLAAAWLGLAAGCRALLQRLGAEEARARAQQDANEARAQGRKAIQEQAAALDQERQALDALADAGQLALAGALSAALARDLNPPLLALAVDARTGLRLLDASPPQVERARTALERI